MSIPNLVTRAFIEEALSTGKEKWVMERQNYNPNQFELYALRFNEDPFIYETFASECKTSKEVEERFSKVIQEKIGPSNPEKYYGNRVLVYRDGECNQESLPPNQIDIPEDKLVTLDIQEVIDYITNRKELREIFKTA